MAMAWEMGSRMLMTSFSQGKVSFSCSASQCASCTQSKGSRAQAPFQLPERDCDAASLLQGTTGRPLSSKAGGIWNPAYRCIVGAAIKCRLGKAVLRRLALIQQLHTCGSSKQAGAWSTAGVRLQSQCSSAHGTIKNVAAAHSYTATTLHSSSGTHLDDVLPLRLCRAVAQLPPTLV